MLSKKQQEWWTAGVAFSATAQAVFDLMNTDPPLALKTIMAAFIDSQVASGNWDFLDCFQFYGMDTEANALIDWIGTSDGINVNGTTFVANNFFSPDGVTKFINSGFQPLTDGTNFVQDSGLMGAYLVAHRSDGSLATGLQAAGGVRRTQIRETAGDIVWSINDGTNNPSGDIYIDESFYLARRTGVANSELFRNGVSISTNVTVSISIHDFAIYVGAQNNGGSTTFPMDCDLSCFVVGGNNSFDQEDFFDNLLIMLQTLGII